MKGIVEYINETLSNDNIKRLSEFITDQNIDFILPKIKKISKQHDLMGDDFKQFFTNKGLDNKSFDNDKEAEIGLRIASYFADDDKNEILKKIKDDNGLISFDELYKGHNLFDFCKNFKDVAKKIALLKNFTSHGANVGKYEILIKFLLKENASSSNKGDISITYNGKPFGMEVKAGDSLQKAAHVSGQTIRSIKEASNKFLDLLEISSDDKTFLGSASSNKRIEKILNDNDILDVDDKIIPSYVNAIAYQYIINDKSVIDSFINKLIEYNKKNNIFSSNDNKVNINSLTNIIGLTQMYFYSNKDKWDCLFTINNESNNYSIIKADEIVDFDNVLDKVSFYPPEGNENATGRRAVSRIFPKNK